MKPTLFWSLRMLMYLLRLSRERAGYLDLGGGQESGGQGARRIGGQGARRIKS